MKNDQDNRATAWFLAPLGIIGWIILLPIALCALGCFVTATIGMFRP